MPASPESTECRLLIDPPAAGAWNMAVDEVLWAWSARTGRCCWRFYRWTPATLSLGYFQPYEDRRRHPASENCPVVRRLSGGGAILHDAELTYSFVLPAGHRLAARRLRLYQTVHTTLIDVLAQRGIAASLCAEPNRAAAAERQPFLCFQRRSPGDVLCGPAKIAGSAQRRSRGAVLQHGSVLLGRSPAAPELDPPSDLAEARTDVRQLTQRWLNELARRLALTWAAEPLSDPERRQAAALVHTKYGSDDWTRNRGR